jgi:hypothetical protein
MLFGHLFDDSGAEGYLVTFSGQQARFTNPDARPNELTQTYQLSWSYPAEASKAADHLIEEAQRERDAYFGVHLFKKANTRRAAHTAPTVQALWLDEDEGHYPEVGPEPTAVVASSSLRRQLYWRLTQPVSVEWAVDMNRRIATWAGGDTGKAGLASVLRPPGTANYKRHPQVDLVTMEISDLHPWEPEVLDQAIPVLATPSSSASLPRPPYDGLEVDLAPYLEAVEVIGELPDGLGAKYAIVCPWVHEHSGGDRTGTRVGQRANGALWFHCDHEHCQGRGWPEFRRAVRPQKHISIKFPRAAGNNDTKGIVIRFD